jgi:two-component system, OmpR family, sensor histidine kinase TctE
VLLTSLYLLSGLRRGLQPLHSLAQHIQQRDQRDLRQIPDSHVFLEVQTLTDTINDLFQDYTQAIAMQQQFIADAAHQLRTPLAGLKLQAERALREQDISAMQPALLHIQHCADRLSHLTTQLLMLAKSEPLSGSYQFVSVNLTELSRDTTREFVPKALQRDMELSFVSPKSAIYVQGNAILLGELLSNLLDNAIAYGREHGTIQVTLEALPTPRLQVEDDGAGIAEAELTKVCERFYRVAGSRGDGCGLGLAIVKEIAVLHHARLELSRVSADGGTRVRVLFR